MSERTAVYRIFGAGRSLLYVGMSDDPSRRLSQHADAKDWWPEVGGTAVEWFPDRVAASAAERHAIRVEKPRYNVQHALTADQEAKLAAAVEAADRWREARARRDEDMARVWQIALEMRGTGFTDIDICATLNLSRATLNRRFGPRVAA